MANDVRSSTKSLDEVRRALAALQRKLNALDINQSKALSSKAQSDYKDPDNQIVRYDKTLDQIQGSLGKINDDGVMSGVTIPAYLPVVFRDFYNGTFRESCNALVTESGGVVTLTITNAGGGDLTMQFNDGDTTLSTPATLTSAAGPAQVLSLGTDEVATMNFIYIPFSTKVLTVSTTGYPTSGEHIRIVTLELASAAYTAAHGARINHNLNDELMGTDLQGHLHDIGEVIRSRGARYISGVDWTFDGDGGSVVTLRLSAGVIRQFHRHVYSAHDTSGSDIIHVVNDPVTAFAEISDINTSNTDSAGGSMAGKFYTVFFFGVANKSSEFSPIMMKLPGGSYNKLSDATHDVSNYNDTTIPTQYTIDSSTGFPIALATFKHANAGNTLTVQSVQDLRAPQSTSGGGGGGVGPLVSFSDALFELFNNTDPTKLLTFDVSAITTATERSITMPDADVDLTPDSGSFIKNVVADTSPQLGGNLDLNNFILNNSGTGNFLYQFGNATTDLFGILDNLGEVQFQVTANGVVTIVEGGRLQIDTIDETTLNAGVTVEAVLVKDGNVDGRNVAADGTKLDGVEALADVTDATNVAAAGAIISPAVNADLADMVQATVKGRAAAAGTGVPVDLTKAQLLTLLGMTNALKISMVFYIEDPVAGKEYPVQMAPAAFTIDKIKHMTDVGTVDFNIEERVTPNVTGVNVFASDEQATSTYQTETAFSNDSIDAEDPIAIDISAVASSPTKLWVYILGTINA